MNTAFENDTDMKGRAQYNSRFATSYCYFDDPELGELDDGWSFLVTISHFIHLGAVDDLILRHFPEDDVY